MAQVPTGTLFDIASAYSAPIAVTAVTNATQAVVTTGAAHTYTNGDFVEINNGWFINRVFRILAASASVLTLEGMDTTSATLYPASGAPGTIRRVSTWTRITTPMQPQVQGGDPNTVNYRYTDNVQTFTITDGFQPVTETLGIDADSNTTAGYLALRTLTASGAMSALRKTLRTGSLIVTPCTVALNESVLFQEGQINMVRCTFNAGGAVTRY
jgi:hypothetical protein